MNTIYLKALEIQGFKSFADKTRLTFEKDITAIVGPNGSGKSNISDAVLWVMGEQRTKALRGNKMEDVIFGGTEVRSPMGFAQVSLILDNSEHLFETEGSELMLTRRYYRSGESEYYINKEPVRLKDINVKEQTLFISREVSKNHKDGKVTLPAVVLKMMLELGVFNAPSTYYLFGHEFLPSAERGTAKQYRDRWAKVRKALGFPKSYKFYSLKDTGITDTVERVGLVVAKDQARHSSIATTNRYIRKEQLTAHPELKNYEGKL